MSTTSIVIVSTIALLIGYDIYAVLTGGVDTTISMVIYRAALVHPVVPFAAGVLCGHFFAPVA